MNTVRYEAPKCPEHPRYHGVRPPTGDCLVCWKLFANNLQRINRRLVGSITVLRDTVDDISRN